MLEQTIWLSPKATAFTAVCEACAAERGYLAAQVEGRLELERQHGSVLCARGHSVRLERANRDPIGVLSNAA
ncbi:MAG: hypothetical protein H0T13_05075 [Actinobacteria bacterium]|nr:hypothetical protein [Actinomycetota bacterium]